MYQCITFKTNSITECYIFYFYLLYCFTFSVKQLILSEFACMYLSLKMLQTLLSCLYIKNKVSSYFFMNLHVLVLLLFSNTVQVITPNLAAQLIRLDWASNG